VTRVSHSLLIIYVYHSPFAAAGLAYFKVLKLAFKRLTNPMRISSDVPKI